MKKTESRALIPDNVARIADYWRGKRIEAIEDSLNKLNSMRSQIENVAAMLEANDYLAWRCGTPTVCRRGKRKEVCLACRAARMASQLADLMYELYDERETAAWISASFVTLIVTPIP